MLRGKLSLQLPLRTCTRTVSEFGCNLVRIAGFPGCAVRRGILTGLFTGLGKQTHAAIGCSFSSRISNASALGRKPRLLQLRVTPEGRQKGAVVRDFFNFVFETV